MDGNKARTAISCKHRDTTSIPNLPDVIQNSERPLSPPNSPAISEAACTESALRTATTFEQKTKPHWSNEPCDRDGWRPRQQGSPIQPKVFPINTQSDQKPTQIRKVCKNNNPIHNPKLVLDKIHIYYNRFSSFTNACWSHLYVKFQQKLVRLLH